MNRLTRAWRRLFPKCRYRGVCRFFLAVSPTCQCGGSYCGYYREFERDFEAKLIERFGPGIDAAPWGHCVVIFDADFSRGWRRVLLDCGYDAHWDYLDGRLAVFVPLKKQEASV